MPAPWQISEQDALMREREVGKQLVADMRECLSPGMSECEMTAALMLRGWPVLLLRHYFERAETVNA